MKRLILGGKNNGKLGRLEALGYNATEITGNTAVLYKLNDTIGEILKKGENPAEWVRENILSKDHFTVVCDEVGAGIVPADRFDREYREAVGRACCAVAAEAEVVERVWAGISSPIKECVEVTLIRHGKTAGNLKGGYVGKTDESVTEETAAEVAAEIESGRYGTADRLFVTGLRRTAETAALIYGGMEAEAIPELNECDFGIYEGMNYEELKNEPDYVKWLESGGTIGFPGGETRAQFVSRCRAGFLKAMEKSRGGEAVSVVCHGGTIMAVLSQFTSKDFYSWQVKTLRGYTFRFDKISREISDIHEI